MVDVTNSGLITNRMSSQQDPDPAAKCLETIESIKVISNCSDSPGETRLKYSDTVVELAERPADTTIPRPEKS